MQDERRTKRELIQELRQLRTRLADHERPESGLGTQRVRQLLEQVPATLWTLDSDLRLTWWRGGGIMAMGLDVAAQIGVTVYDFFGTTNPQHPSVLAHEAALRGEASDVEVEINAGQWLQAHLEPMRGEDGEITGVMGVALDISERVRAEAELRQALEKVKTLSGLIPICAHCKSMRNDQGYWQHLEIFMREHSDVELSHGICPTCKDRLLSQAR